MLMRQHATITAEHQLRLDDNALWRAQLATMKPGRVVVTVESEALRRTTDANRYWFCRVVKFFQKQWSAGREALSLPPYSKWDTHSVLVQSFVGSEPGPIPGTVLHVPTKVMTVEQFSRMTDAARMYAWDTYQARIPSGGEPEDYE